MALVQALAALLLISNTIQLAAFNRRDETDIMRLVGASRWYTQLPFILEAALAGLVGALLAIGGLVAAKFLFVDKTLAGPIRSGIMPPIDLGAIAGDQPGTSAGVGVILAGVAAYVTPLAAVTYGLPRPVALGDRSPSGSSSAPRPDRKIIASNRKARHDYSILDTYEAGIALTGTEVKTLRAGRASLVDGFATIDDGEVWLQDVHIAEYAQGTWTNHAPRRKRKLLLHKAEIERLEQRTKEGGLTLVPLELYFTGGQVKVELALARGKRSYDKRQDLAKRDAHREIARELGRRVKGRG